MVTIIILMITDIFMLTYTITDYNEWDGGSHNFGYDTNVDVDENIGRDQEDEDDDGNDDNDGNETTYLNNDDNNGTEKNENDIDENNRNNGAQCKRVRPLHKRQK